MFPLSFFSARFLGYLPFSLFPYLFGSVEENHCFLLSVSLS